MKLGTAMEDENGGNYIFEDNESTDKWEDRLWCTTSIKREGIQEIKRKTKNQKFVELTIAGILQSVEMVRERGRM